jgi:hypothetical protein
MLTSSWPALKRLKSSASRDIFPPPTRPQGCSNIVAIPRDRSISICQPIGRGAAVGGNVTGIEIPSAPTGILREREADQGTRLGASRIWTLVGASCFALRIRHPAGGIDIGDKVDGAEAYGSQMQA